MKLAIISDIHSNVEAFQAVLKDIKKRKIKKIYCAGDIVGYNANPNECIDLNNRIPPIYDWWSSGILCAQEPSLLVEF